MSGHDSVLFGFEGFDYCFESRNDPGGGVEVEGENSVAVSYHITVSNIGIPSGLLFLCHDIVIILFDVIMIVIVNAFVQPYFDIEEHFSCCQFLDTFKPITRSISFFVISPNYLSCFHRIFVTNYCIQAPGCHYAL